MSAKIGVGVTTYNRPKHYALWVEQFIQHSPLKWFVYDDSRDRRGIAFGKNQCLKALSDCDYIFLFDDDCLVLKDGWIDFFISAYQTSEQHHFLFLKESPTIKHIVQILSINIFNNCGGAFMFLTKEVIEKVGGFDERFGRYSFEHANYSQRIHQAGLTTMGAYLCPAGAGEYIYSLDFDNHLNFNIKHFPSMPIKETIECINFGNKHFQNKIDSIYLPL